jgi:16S rRNA (cytosine1402-N4)-methyltransferase
MKGSVSVMHQPVLVAEVLSSLRIKKDGSYIDGTAGSGGHAEAILEQLGSAGRLLAIDRDADAVARVEKRLHGDGRCSIVNGNFEDMERLASVNSMQSVDGILLDLGVSSEQLETGERGFSFGHDGPLDMRMTREEGRTAADIVNDSDEHTLVELLREYGEERQARRIVRAIIKARETKRLHSTRELSEAVARAVGGRRGRLHPATRTFQALRIAVNTELDSLERGLEAGIGILKVGGRMAVISFHSLEDRCVKQCMREHAGRWVSLQAGGREWQGKSPSIALLNRKPIQPGPEEVARNPRARSAKLRTIERIAESETA